MAVATAAFDDFDEDIKSLGDRIVCLSLKQAVELSEYLRYTYGLEVSTNFLRSPGDKPYIDPRLKEFYLGSDDFDVILESFGEKKINVIKEVRAITGMGLKEAKSAVENTPFKIREAVLKSDAEAAKKLLEDAGAVVTIISTPRG